MTRCLAEDPRNRFGDIIGDRPGVLLPPPIDIVPAPLVEGDRTGAKPLGRIFAADLGAGGYRIRDEEGEEESRLIPFDSIPSLPLRLTPPKTSRSKTDAGLTLEPPPPLSTPPPPPPPLQASKTANSFYCCSTAAICCANNTSAVGGTICCAPQLPHAAICCTEFCAIGAVGANNPRGAAGVGAVC